MKLPVNIAANGDRRRDGLHGCLLDQQHLHHVTKLFEVRLWQVLALFDFFDPRVQIILLGHSGQRGVGERAWITNWLQKNRRKGLRPDVSRRL